MVKKMVFMKTAIFYFSGTGNSLKVAKDIVEWFPTACCGVVAFT